MVIERVYICICACVIYQRAIVSLSWHPPFSLKNLLSRPDKSCCTRPLLLDRVLRLRKRCVDDADKRVIILFPISFYYNTIISNGFAIFSYYYANYCMNHVNFDGLEGRTVDLPWILLFSAYKLRLLL